MLAVLLIVVSFSSSVIFSAQIDGISDLSTTTAYKSLPCTTDRDCPETKYCFTQPKRHVCAPCFNCSSRNRQNRIRCARTSQDCGDCLPGFISHTWPHIRRWCTKDVQARAQPRVGNDSGELINVKLMVLIFCCFSVSGLIASYAFCHKINRRRRRVIISNAADVEPTVSYCSSTTSATATATAHTTSATVGIPPPPSYQETMDLDDDEVSCTLELRVVEHAVLDQKAIPYLGEHDNITEEQSADNSTVSGDAVQTAPSEPSTNIHDEDTVPSLWVPGDDYGHDAHAQNQIAQVAQGTTNDSKPTKRKFPIDCENCKKKKGG